MNFRTAVLLFYAVSANSALSQNPAPPPSSGIPPVLTTQSNLVLVPTSVTTLTGESVYSLTAQDFSLTDNGIEQQLAVDDDPGRTPLSLVVVVETGGFAATQVVPNLSRLDTMVEAIVGEQPHEVALVSFDSQPHLVQDFTANLTDIEKAVQQLHASDGDPAILDSVQFAANLFQNQPAEFRHVILLISETIDRGSQAKLDDVLQTLRSTNAPIYSVAFSTTKAEVTNTLTTPSPGRAKRAKCLQDNPGAPPGTCRGQGAFGRLLLLVTRLGQDDDGSASNVPQIMASVTGGRYLPFDSGSGKKSLDTELFMVANDLPNRYMLSFRPVPLAPGLHTLQVRVRGSGNLQISARTSYWVNDKSPAKSHP